MRTLRICFKLIIVAAGTLTVVYLFSLPYYYFALTWKSGTYSILLEDIFIGVLAAAGFFGFRWFDHIFRDDGSGDLYLWSAILIIMVILFAFRHNSSYALGLSRILYSDGVKYKNLLVFDGGMEWSNFTDLVKFSSVYIITYAAAFCFLLALFGRSLWNQKMPSYFTKLKLDFYEWSDRIRDADRESINASNSGQKNEETGGIFPCYSERKYGYGEKTVLKREKNCTDERET